ncbi:hypothetical protein NDN08_005606 [Rhodosorus marinus]|uniref:RING-Gid-type domain-containing protein n=1 Tax=Rhodosorus marinus TaxID=101924 RepID=A0AAV8V3J3_9RHOD|nr:hypothetical protein NDN08_005606 [Rhodosorus marinus]
MVSPTNLAIECERARKRQCVSHERLQKSLSQVIAKLESLSEDVERLRGRGCEDTSNSPKELLVGASEVVEQTQKYIVADQKEMYKTLTSLSKAVDRTTVPGVENLCSPNVRLEKDRICEAIANHLFRCGAQNLGEAFVREAGLSMGATPPVVFEDMNEIIDALAVRNVQPAIAWVKSARGQPQTRRRSSLEFGLHRLVYLSRLADGNWEGALEYGRANFGDFVTTHMDKIQQLMGCLMYFNRLESSPYAELFSPLEWTEVAMLFARDYLNSHDQPFESPLKNVVDCAVKALPSLLKARKILKRKSPWTKNELLPVEVDLGSDSQYHSIFTCPVLRVESTEKNPPMILPCGHVLSRESLSKLPPAPHPGHGSESVQCPYCSSATRPAECREIHF